MQAAFASRLALTMTVAALVAVGAAGSAWAKAPSGGSAAGTGIDVSYPQCGNTLPTGQAFAIVGVNGGLANDYNSCLNAQFSYAQNQTSPVPGQAQPRAQTYLNTADPGNSVADWPSPAQPGAYGANPTAYGTCDYATTGVSSGPGANSAACAYVYGYDMVAGITYTGGAVEGDLTAFATATGTKLYSVPAWLDVETANSWQPGTGNGYQMNIAALQGMVDGLNAAARTAGLPGAQSIGIYTTSSQWGAITGTPTAAAAGNLSGLSVWIPGATSKSGAVANCSATSFTGGRVSLTQWFGHPYDGDYSCP